MEGDARTVWTVGHSNHCLERFVGLLASEAIECVVDVRSYPYSQFAPHFNREEIGCGLRDAGVNYLFLGAELGGRPDQEDHYDAEGRALYEPMSRVPAFVAAVERVIAGAAKHRVALVCSEGRPETCHRRLLVGKVLCDRGLALRHILPEGGIHEEQVVRLAPQGLQSSLFGDEETPWRSTQSVSRRQRLSTSSAV